jgi:hypothetical protein
MASSTRSERVPPKNNHTRFDFFLSHNNFKSLKKSLPTSTASTIRTSSRNLLKLLTHYLSALFKLWETYIDLSNTLYTSSTRLFVYFT